MKNYAVVSAATDVRRSFAITLGLQEGYGPTGTTHTAADVVAAAAEWMKTKAAAGLNFLTGTVSGEGTVVYAYPDAPSRARRSAER
jgi:cell wall assembly regulator SMI1